MTDTLRSFAHLVDDTIVEIVGDYRIDAPPASTAAWDGALYDAHLEHRQQLRDMLPALDLEHEGHVAQLIETTDKVLSRISLDDQAVAKLKENLDRARQQLAEAHESRKSAVTDQIAAYDKILDRYAGDALVGTVILFEDRFTEAFRQNCAEITDLKPPPELGWRRGDDGKFAAPPVYEPTPEQRAAAMIFAGCEIHSTGTPALNATYDAVGPRWEQMLAELAYIRDFGVFSAGLAEVDWIAKSGEVVFQTTDQFKAVVRAVSDWLTLCRRYADGKGEKPVAAVIIP